MNNNIEFVLKRFYEETLLQTYNVRIINGKITVRKDFILNNIPSIENQLKDYFENPNDEILVYKTNFESVVDSAKSLVKSDKEKLLEYYKTINVSLEKINGNEALLNQND